jgi:hypothetical protein
VGRRLAGRLQTQHASTARFIEKMVRRGKPLLVVLRAAHRLADQDNVTLADLARDRLGVPSDALFPAWALAQRQALDDAAISPPVIELDATDLSATVWTAQPEVDWILTTATVNAGTTGTVVLPVSPANWFPTHCSGIPIGHKPPPSPASSMWH